MASNGISDGIENLCLTDHVNKEDLGAVPKMTKTQNSDQTDGNVKKQQKKKNRKDKRRSDTEVSETSSKASQMSKVEKLRVERGVQRSDSDKRTSSPLSSQSDIADLLFRTNSKVNVSLSMGVKNLPDSFFSDKLPEELQQEEIEAKEKSEARDHKKRKRRKQKRKQTSTEEEDKQGSEKENIEEDKLNEKLIDDDIGEEIVTNYGDEQCVVSIIECKYEKGNKNYF